MSRAGKCAGPNHFWWNVKVIDTGEMKSIDTSRMMKLQNVDVTCGDLGCYSAKLYA